MVYVRLESCQREELRRLWRDKETAARTRERLEMVRLSDAGWSAPRIAVHLGVHQNTVRKYLKAFLCQGFAALPDKPKPGPVAKVTEEHLLALERLLDGTDRTWTSPKLAAWLLEEYGVSVHPGWLSQLLHKRGFGYKRTKNSVAHKADKELQAEKDSELEALKKGGKGRSH